MRYSDRRTDLFSNRRPTRELPHAGLADRDPFPYAPGVLKAVGTKDGHTFSTEVRTEGPPAKLLASADRQQLAADGTDLSYVDLRVVDKDGNLCPNADNLIHFSLQGPATLAGVDNGDPTNHEPFQATQHKAFHGLCLAVIKAKRTPGQIQLQATADGLEAVPVLITGVVPAP